MAQRSNPKRRREGPGATSAGEQSPPKPMASRYERSRAKDAEVRAALVPLEPGERPTAVTVAAILALVLGLLNVVLYLAGLEVQGQRPNAPGVLAYGGLMLLAAWGMWRARYWAVLGMQALLMIVIVIFSILLIRFENVLELLIALTMVGSAGTLFWFLVKAMARIQMPDRPS